MKQHTQLIMQSRDSQYNLRKCAYLKNIDTVMKAKAAASEM